MSTSNNISIAIPSSAGIEDLFASVGYKPKKKSSRFYCSDATAVVGGEDVNLKLIPFKASDVPDMMARSQLRKSFNSEQDKIVAAITDQDIIAGMKNTKQELQTVCMFPGGSNGGADTVSWKCLVRNDSEIREPKQLGQNKMKIECKIPLLAERWLQKYGVEATVGLLNGKAEAALQEFLCDAVIDVVDSGQSRDENTLREIGPTVFESSRVMVADPSALKRDIVRKTLFQVSTVLIGSLLKNTRVQIWANVPKSLLGDFQKNPLFYGAKGPLSVDMGRGDFCEFMTSVPKNRQNDAVSELLSMGADDVEIVPLTSSVSMSSLVQYMPESFLVGKPNSPMISAPLRDSDERLSSATVSIRPKRQVAETDTSTTPIINSEKSCEVAIDWLLGLSDIVRQRAEKGFWTNSTTRMLRQGTEFCATRYVAEAGELSKAIRTESTQNAIEEAGQCFYWFFVALQSKGYSFDDVLSSLSLGQERTSREKLIAFFARMESTESFFGNNGISGAAVSYADDAITFSTALRKKSKEEAIYAASGSLQKLLLLLRIADIDLIAIMDAERSR